MEPNQIEKQAGDKALESSAIDLAQVNLSGRQFRTGVSLCRAADVTEAELEVLSAIYMLGFTAPPWNECWSFKDARKALDAYGASESELIIARSNGMPAGLVAGLALDGYSGSSELRAFTLSARPLYLADLVVDSRCRGQGIAGALVAEFIAASERLGYTEIITRTRPDNESALRVFSKLGFIECGQYETVTGGIASPRAVLVRTAVIKK